MVDAEEGVTADADVFALFEGLNDDGVAGAWVDRLRFTFSILTSPITFALSALDLTTCARIWEWCWLQLALLERW
jgi:hypothetical protein